VWFTWPAWPFAGWAIYAWRKQITALHIALPLSFFIMLTVLALCSPHSEQSSLIPLIPPLSILAAFGLPTMKRGAINAVDWFSVIAFSLVAIFVWLCWIAMQTGWPSQLHHNIFKSVPGFVARFNLAAFIIALITTCAWLKLVQWRISRQPSVLWRAVVLSSSGVILCWLLSMTLWMPWVNYRVSYQPLAHDLAAHLPPKYNCVDSNVGPAQRALFAYFGNIRFAHFAVEQCDYFLAEERESKPPSVRNKKAVWKGHRASDKSDRFALYRIK
jgi:4-amino-4-deoxy-L-arabinose transferase-like glycosyltransferase